MTLFEELKARGLIAQMTHEEEIKKLLETEKVTFYIGFDPTADSLHVGHFMQMVIMARFQRAGHNPIALFGGGTGLVGDPSGRTDMRQMLTREQIDYNISRFVEQFQPLVQFGEGEGKARMVNNADWLCNLNYIDFLRDVGVHFSVNRMLSAECFKTRLEKGLSFIEFNYMLMQGYDFLVLSDKYNCKIEFGGDDQWSNIIGGIELVRRARGKEVYGMTFSLLTTSEGKKMGKTQSGAVWLDPEKTTPYEFYQYWRNIEDNDVIKCLKMLTFVSLEKIYELEKLEGAELNVAKELLAYEVTKMVHGEDEANKVQEAAKSVFTSGNSVNMPTTDITKDVLSECNLILDIMKYAKLIGSKNEGRTLVTQGGVSINDEKVMDIARVITEKDFIDGEMIIKKGKKVFHKIVLK